MKKKNTSEETDHGSENYKKMLLNKGETTDASFCAETTNGVGISVDKDDDHFSEKIQTVIESEDIGFLVERNFEFEIQRLKNVARVEELLFVLSKNLNGIHKLKCIKLIKKILMSIPIKNPTKIVSNLKNSLTDYSKLFYLRGKVEFLKQRMIDESFSPENVIEE